MTDTASSILLSAVYGLSGFTMCGFVTLRALTGPATSFRNRLFAFATFGFLLAAYAWINMALLVMSKPVPEKFMLGIAALACLPLYYFAFNQGLRLRVTYVVICVSIFVWFIIAIYFKDATPLETFTRMGISVPSTFCAAFMFLRDPAFRTNKEKVDAVLWAAALSLLAFSGTQVVSVLVSHIHLPITDLEGFNSEFRLRMYSIRAALMLFFTIDILLLLGRFERLMREEAAKKATQQEIKHTITESQLAGIVKLAPEAIIITDDKMRIELFSRGAELTFGYVGHEIIGQQLDRLIPSRFLATCHHHVQDFSAAREQPQRMGERWEIFGLRKNGEEFPAQASMSKFETPKGVTFTTILYDISAEKAARNELINAKLAAEAANEAKSRFLANMSHELRTPLNAIIGFASFLTEEIGIAVTRQKRLEYAKDIQGAGHHLLKIINDILDISRIEVGKIQLNEEVVIIDDLVESCLRMERTRAEEVGIKIKTEKSTLLPAILIDPRLLTQVLLNIVSNALKFTERGGRIIIAASWNSDGGINLSVRDTGSGMSPKDIMRVGEPFMQADSSHTRKHEGAGLGLAVSKRLVELHNGNLRVESILGQGTTVIITLPASRIVREADGSHRLAQFEANPPRQELKHSRVI